MVTQQNMEINVDLYIARHGQTALNAKKIVQGKIGTEPLNEEGRQQSQKLGKRLSKEKFDHIFSSPLKRAFQTAEIVAESHSNPDIKQKKIEIVDDLMEMNYGDFEGQTYDPKNKSMPNCYESLKVLKAQWKKKNFNVGPKNGETPMQLLDRSQKAIAQIFETIGKNIIESKANDQITTADKMRQYSSLVLTHGRLIRVLIPYLLNIGLDKMEDYEGTNTCLSKIRVVGLLDPKTLKFSGIKDSKPIFVNSTDHLEVASEQTGS